ncbi:response regulator [Catenovulum sediminis]|uniref:Response regulator n=1 Tax=Catenovulum sediminis TaxID=1740262 RepID=A0ABV1RJ05_9ALTE
MNRLNRYTKLSFLLVDDFAEFRTSLKSILNGIGAQDIDMAANAETAISLYQQKRHDIILCDFNLGPNSINGQQLMESLKYRELLKAESIFMIISADNFSNINTPIDCQADGYLTKPFNRQILRKKLDRILDQKNELNDILKLQNSHKYDLAIQACNDYIKGKNQYSFSCLQLKIDCYLKIAAYHNALQLLDALITKRATNWVLINHAKCLIALGQYTKAIESLDLVLTTNSNSVSARDLKCEAFMSLGEFKQAFEEIEHAIQLAVASTYRYRVAALLAEQNNDLAKAVLYRKKINNQIPLTPTHLEEDTLKYLNVLCQAISACDGRQQSYYHNDYQTAYSNATKSTQGQSQFQTALLLSKCIYLKVSEQLDTLNTTLKQIEALVKLENHAKCRSFLKYQLVYILTEHPYLLADSPAIQDYCNTTNCHKRLAINVLKANQLYEKAKLCNSNNMLTEQQSLLTQAFSYAPFNSNIAIKLLLVLGKNINLQSNQNEYSDILETCINHLKSLDPSDQRFIIFRNELKRFINQKPTHIQQQKEV